MSYTKTDDPINNICRILTEQYRAGGFTHAYVAAGLLAQPEPSFEYELGDSDACFDLASLTKALQTTPLVLQVLKNYNLSLDSTIGDLLSYRVRQKKLPFSIEHLKIGHLLSHTSGLPDWLSLWMLCKDDPFWEQLTPAETTFQRIGRAMTASGNTGEHCYSDLGFILLALILDFLEEWPKNMGMSVRLLDWPASILGSRQEQLFSGREKQEYVFAPTGFCRIRNRVLCGEVHDENAWFLGASSGHAGLFSTGRGLLRFLKMLWFSSSGQELIQLQEAYRKPTQGMVGLMGWQQGNGESSKVFGEGRAIGHLGFTGTAFWMLPQSGKYAVLLTNRIVSGRVSHWITPLRRECFLSMDHILR